MKLFNNFNLKYKLNYNKLTPLMASNNTNFSANSTHSELRRPSWSTPTGSNKPPAEKPRPHRPAADEQPSTAALPEKATKPQTAKRKVSRLKKRKTKSPNGAGLKIKSRRLKRPPIITATITGLLLSVIVLLATTGLYGAYCYAHGTHGDSSVTASIAMYMLAVFCGCFWSAAVVKRRSTLPPIIIGSVYLICSVVISAQMFTVADFKFLMIIQKLIFTGLAGFAGYVLSIVPYLLNKALRHK